jgi:hypothetical protein
MDKSSSDSGTWHIVEDGEWIGSIAMENGFTDWDKQVWQHPNNAELRRFRDDPRVLGVGDKVFVPQRRPASVPVATGKRHRFKLKTPTEVFRFRLLGPDGKPLAEEEYVLTIDCKPGGSSFQQQHQATDDEGMLTEVVPSTATEGRLYLPAIAHGIELVFGHLTPMDLGERSKLIRGAQERLHALGFDPGPLDGVDGPRTRAAVEAFQAFCRDHSGGNDPTIIDSGPVDGIVGPKTRKALMSYYGS